MHGRARLIRQGNPRPAPPLQQNDGGPQVNSAEPELGTQMAAFAWIDRLPRAALLIAILTLLCLVLSFSAGYFLGR